MISSLICALAGSAGCLQRSLAPAEPAWLEAESAHFILRGDVGDDEARAALAHLERVRQALIAGSWHAQDEPPAKAHVILLADDEELRDYVQPGVVAFAGTDPFEAPLLVASESSRLGEQVALTHELAHQIDNAFLLRQPRWLSEGLASYLETLTLGDASVTLGDVNRDRLAYLRGHPQLQLAWVMSAGPEIYSLPPEALKDFYAQSWLLVHYLANERRPQLDAWVDRLALAEEPQKAWTGSFGSLDAAQLTLELQRYLQHGEFKTYTYPLRPLETRSAVRPLGRAEALAELALLRAISFGKASAQTAARAALEAELALRADPKSALAASVWFFTGKRGQGDELAVARAVIAGHPDDARGYELLGLALGPSDAQAQTAALESAARLAPTDARALAQLAFVYLTSSRIADGLAAARKAVQLAPGNASYLETLALALAANGRCADAAAIEQRAIDLVPDRASAERARHFRDSIGQLDEVCRAQRSGQKTLLQLSEEGTVPAEAAGACKDPGLQLPASALGERTSLSVDFAISPEGEAVDIAVPGATPQIREAVVAYLRGCPFKAAQGPGGPLRWPMNITFTFAPPEREAR